MALRTSVLNNEEILESTNSHNAEDPDIFKIACEISESARRQYCKER